MKAEREGRIQGKNKKEKQGNERPNYLVQFMIHLEFLKRSEHV
jgi:hypothetical protein